MSDDGISDEWYARRGSNVLGPYSRDDLERYILLGRVRLSDRVSTDGHTWYRLTECAELIPAAMQDLQSAEGRARFEEARRQADERGGRAARRLGGRRAEDRIGARSTGAVWAAGGVLGVVIVALIAIGWQLDFGGVPGASPDCEAPAAPGVDWSYCVFAGLELDADTDLGELRAINVSLRGAGLAGVRLAGARLMHADLADADLTGADLSDADLEGADLSNARLTGASLGGANLRHADLRGADLDDVDLRDAELAGAAWAPGQWCRQGSIGQCLLQ